MEIIIMPKFTLEQVENYVNDFTKANKKIPANRTTAEMFMSLNEEYQIMSLPESIEEYKNSKSQEKNVALVNMLKEPTKQFLSVTGDIMGGRGIFAWFRRQTYKLGAFLGIDPQGLNIAAKLSEQYMKRFDTIIKDTTNDQQDMMAELRRKLNQRAAVDPHALKELESKRLEDARKAQAKDIAATPWEHELDRERKQVVEKIVHPNPPTEPSP